MMSGWLAFADPTRPAELRIRNILQAPDPGPFTATIGSTPGYPGRMFSPDESRLDR